VVALRTQVPDRPRPLRLRWLPALSRVAFVVVSLIIYWTGWQTMWKLSVPIAAGALVLVWRLARDRGLADSMDVRSAVWLAPYYVGLVTLAFLGNFGGGREAIPAPLDIVAVSAFALAVFEWAIRAGLSPEDAVAATAAVPVPDLVEDAPETKAEPGSRTKASDPGASSRPRGASLRESP
jgi:hypothetical protein